MNGTGLGEAAYWGVKLRGALFAALLGREIGHDAADTNTRWPPCCAFENRSFAGGCLACGAPCL